MRLIPDLVTLNMRFYLQSLHQRRSLGRHSDGYTDRLRSGSRAAGNRVDFLLRWVCLAFTGSAELIRESLLGPSELAAFAVAPRLDAPEPRGAHHEGTVPHPDRAETQRAMTVITVRSW